ncbi:hypothetical protein IGS59_03410 [Janthinobacterium sp. GW460P]|uniref:hypothetical protein n=1 Tax=unclassified Janthinobacterium TaxID=2610881 RepID=UPI00111F7FE9|nr:MULTISPECIES: hypothetical protein [unclassified Janthinobacterium]MCC7701274.1 hypothetical protein [Janthinobacterium sp. GW460P]MCC7706781.1 hypothetical protein [Janthinobacterium sp. GW460W]
MRSGFAKLRLGQALRLGVAADGLSLWRGSRWRAPAWTPLGDAAYVPDAGQGLHGDFSALGQALAQLLERLLPADHYAGWPLSVVLDDGLARLWQVDLPQGAARLADIEAAAALRFQSLYGDAPGLWHSSSAWDARAPFFCAVPRALLAQLTRVAAERKLALIFITPQFARHWNRWHGALKPGAWFGQLQENALTLGVRRDGRLCAVRALPVPPGAGRDWLVQTLAREALLQGVPAPALLQLCGAPPPAWLTPTKEFHCQVFATPDGQGALSPAGRLAHSGGVA